VGAGIGILDFGTSNSFIVPLYSSAKPIGDKHSMDVGLQRLYDQMGLCSGEKVTTRLRFSVRQPSVINTALPEAS